MQKHLQQKQRKNCNHFLYTFEDVSLSDPRHQPNPPAFTYALRPFRPIPTATGETRSQFFYLPTLRFLELIADRLSDAA